MPDWLGAGLLFAAAGSLTALALFGYYGGYWYQLWTLPKENDDDDE